MDFDVERNKVITSQGVEHSGVCPVSDWNSKSVGKKVIKRNCRAAFYH